MKSYGQFCPVAMALEILAERWTLLVVRELLCGSRRFNDILRGVPLMSRTLLSQRLKTLEEHGLVLRRSRAGGGHEYQLTRAGQELLPLVQQLGAWGKRWASHEVRAEHLDPALLMWDMHRRIDHDALPSGRLVLRFDFSGGQQAKQRYWLCLENGEADVCFSDPGFEVDLVVQTDPQSLTDVWLGHRLLAQALRDKSLQLEGTAALKRQFPLWFRLSLFAEVEMPDRAESVHPAT